MAKYFVLLFLVPFIVLNVSFHEMPKGEAYFTEKEESSAFRNVKVEGEKGVYEVKGDAKTKSGTFFYTVEDGHNQYVDETRVSSGTEWQPFIIRIQIPKEKLPDNATLILYLYEKDETGGIANSLPVVLETLYQ